MFNNKKKVASVEATLEGWMNDVGAIYSIDRHY